MPNSPIPKGRLLAIGGHEQRRAPDRQPDGPDVSADFILQRFVNELPSKRTIVVIPTASEAPAEAAHDYVEVFTALGIERV